MTKDYDVLDTTKGYSFVLSEGEIRAHLAKIEALREQTGQAHCICIRLQPVGQNRIAMRNAIEVLTPEMVRGAHWNAEEK